MIFNRLIQFATPQPCEVVAARLSAAVLPGVATLKPVCISDWIGQQQGKRFVGNFDGSRFKLKLLQNSGGRFRVRSGAMVIVGALEFHSFQARLRLPFFILGFLAVFAVALSAGLVLSFFGPANLPILQAAMALTLAMPFAVVAWSFRREATEAEQALRQVVLGLSEPSSS